MKSPLRILVVISNLGFGGAERQVIELAKHIDKKRCELHICSLSDHIPIAESWVDREQRLHVIKKNAKFDFSVVFKLAKLMQTLEIQVVHGFLFDAEISSRLAGKLANIPVIIGSERNSNHHYRFIHRFAYKLTRSLITRCIANSSAGAKFNRETFHLPEAAYSVVHNGVDTERFKPRDVNSLRQQLGILEGEQIIGMFGSFKRQKNHPLLFTAAAKLKSQRENFRILIVGATIQEGAEPTDEYHAMVLQQVKELQLKDKCIFLGARSDVELVYNLCDITVLPSLFEGTPNVALESMASGIPVIATDVADNKQVIPDTKVGFIVTLGDSDILAERIATLLDDHDRRQAFGTNARHWVEQHYSLTRMADKMASIYESEYALQKK